MWTNSFFVVSSFCLFHNIIAMEQKSSFYKRTMIIKEEDISPKLLVVDVSNVFECVFACNDGCFAIFFFNNGNKTRCGKAMNNLEISLLPNDIDSDLAGQVSLYVKTDNIVDTCYDHSSKVNPISILPNGLIVLCDTETDNGGWVIIHRRLSDDVDFYRGWDDYVQGFGYIEGNFWYGLDKINTLCSEQCQMRFDFTFDSQAYWATYNVKIDSADDNYRLHLLDGFSGNAGDSLRGPQSVDGMGFSTYDKDNDGRDGSCAVDFNGAWWYRSCHHVHFNGLWGSVEKAKGVIWRSITGMKASVSSAEIKVRRL